jgi:iron complex transport system permease protein
MPASKSARERGRAALALCLAFFGLGAAFLVSLCLGSVRLPPRDVAAALVHRLSGGAVAADPLAVTIVWELRLARTLLACTAGAALGAAGAVLQGLFRNPLADPYSLGVSSGASLGAVTAIAFGIVSPFAWLGARELLAFGGAIGTAVLVYLIAKTSRRAAPVTALLLAGTAVGAFVSALVSLILSLNDRDLHQVFFWLLGGFGGKSWPELATALPPALVSIILSLVLARPLDLLGAGEEAASSLGLDVARTRRLAVASSSLGAAAAVSAGGIIGFVGLLGPHMARLVAGPAHRRLVPLSTAAGAALLMVADAIARSVAAPIELPVGVVTALAGAPLFLHLLARRGMEAR